MRTRWPPEKRHAQRRGGLGAHAAVRRQSVFPLKAQHRVARGLAIAAVRRAGHVAVLNEPLLHLDHVAALAAHLQYHRRKRAAGQAQRHHQRRGQCQRPPHRSPPSRCASQSSTDCTSSADSSTWHSVGYSTHHQLCPSPVPMVTRRARYSPAGTSSRP